MHVEASLFCFVFSFFWEWYYQCVNILNDLLKYWWVLCTFAFNVTWYLCISFLFSLDTVALGGLPCLNKGYYGCYCCCHH